MSKNLIKKIQNFASQHDLWNKNSKIVVGVSGGPDSVCLLSVLLKLSLKYNFKLHVTHVNYGLRGVHSDDDEKFVIDLCKNNHLNFSILNVKKNLLKKNPSENELRDIRYDFFEKIRKENNFDTIAIAHNQDDQAETVLMRIIRGSGLQGLRAIQPKRDNVIRPLLEISRKDILKYLKVQKMKYRIDRTNREIIFLRNKVRNRLIPYLEKNYNPKIKQVLASNASNISQDYDALLELSQKKMRLISLKLKKDHSAQFSSKKFNQLHPAIQKNILRLLIQETKNDLKEIENKHLEEIIKISKSTKGKHHFSGFKGLKIERKGDRISMTLQQN